MRRGGDEERRRGGEEEEEEGDNGMRCGPHSIGHGSHGPALD